LRQLDRLCYRIAYRRKRFLIAGIAEEKNDISLSYRRSRGSVSGGLTSRVICIRGADAVGIPLAERATDRTL